MRLFTDPEKGRRWIGSLPAQAFGIAARPGKFARPAPMPQHATAPLMDVVARCPILPTALRQQ